MVLGDERVEGREVDVDPVGADPGKSLCLRGAPTKVVTRVAGARTDQLWVPLDVLVYIGTTVGVFGDQRVRGREERPAIV